MLKRTLEDLAFREQFGRQMRFVAGPRQVGKTTLARGFITQQGTGDFYYNWDRREVRSRFKADPYFYHADCLKGKAPKPAWIVFDEIHKYPRWKDILKDAFDSFEDFYRFIITGSARLDLFRRAGDSLSGRYFLFKLLPVTLCELTGRPIPAAPEDSRAFVENQIASASRREDLDHLLTFGGFPEPLLKGDPVYSNNWREEYVESLIREDLRDLSKIHDLENVATLIRLLPPRIGSPLSLNALREEMEVSHTAIRNYLRYLILTYVLFQLAPYTRRISRSIKKEKKAYFFDWTRVEDPARRFENYVAVELLNRVEYWSSASADRYEFFYLRDRAGHETDFLVTRAGRPFFLVEAKLGAEPVEPHHRRHAEAAGKIPFIQVVQNGAEVLARPDGVYVIPADRLF